MAPEDRRGAIVDAALAAALRKGLGAITVRDVAAEMGSSSGLVHHYFASMDDVVAAAFERAAAADLEQAVRTVEAEPGPVEMLSAFIRSYTPATHDRTMQLWLDAWAEAARCPALQAVSRRLNLGWQLLVRSILDRGVSAGVFACPDTDASAWRIISVLDGLALQVVAHGDGAVEPVAWSAVAAEAEVGLAPGTLGSSPAEPVSRRGGG